MCASEEELCLQLLCMSVCAPLSPPETPAGQQGGIQGAGGFLDPPQEPQPRMISGWAWECSGTSPSVGTAPRGASCRDLVASGLGLGLSLHSKWDKKGMRKG